MHIWKSCVYLHHTKTNMKNEITKGTKLQSINNKNLVVIFKSYVGTNKTEFRTVDDFQFRLDEFIVID